MSFTKEITDIGAGSSTSGNITTDNNLTVGGNITLGTDADGTDRTIIFGHSTLKSIMGIDDDQDKFAINTDGAFESVNDLEISSTGNVVIGNGDLIIQSGAKLRLDGNSSGDTYFTESSANVVRLYTGSSGHYVTMTTTIAENSNTVYGKDAGTGMHSSNVNNTFIGDAVAALGTMTSVATNNTGVGTGVLENLTSGQKNTGVGSGALNAITEGYKNTAIGRASGNAITTGIKNICIGSDSEISAVDTDNEIVIGVDTTGLGTNSTVLGNSSCSHIYMSEDSGAIVHCGAIVHGLSSATVTSSTLAYASHSVAKGKFVRVTADAQTLVLPAVVVGAVFIIVNDAADGTALLTIDPDGNDKFLIDIAGAAGTDGNTISNTKATQNKGDFVKLVGMSADGWAITEIGGIWADE